MPKKDVIHKMSHYHSSGFSISKFPGKPEEWNIKLRMQITAKLIFVLTINVTTIILISVTNLS